jgi:hypothetical protein
VPLLRSSAKGRANRPLAGLSWAVAAANSEDLNIVASPAVAQAQAADWQDLSVVEKSGASRGPARISFWADRRATLLFPAKLIAAMPTSVPD